MPLRCYSVHWDATNFSTSRHKQHRFAAHGALQHQGQNQNRRHAVLVLSVRLTCTNTHKQCWSVKGDHSFQGREATLLLPCRLTASDSEFQFVYAQFTGFRCRRWCGKSFPHYYQLPPPPLFPFPLLPSKVHTAHVAFLNFERSGLPRPVYLASIRDPMSRLISHYSE